ncbi:MAG: helix-turn-helix transcriptional regulator [Alphaproteobacteria bacterium]
MAGNNETRTAPGGSRRALLDRLKRAGPQEARDLATHLGVTAMAARQHLYALEAEGIVAAEQQPRPRGRPVKLWRLTEAAAPFFPDGHAELTLGLLDAMTAAFGARGLGKLIAARTEAQRAAYGARIRPHWSLKRRVEALARIRAEEGYMAEVRNGAAGAGRGVYLLVENHCPICAAARACRGLCQRELDLFQEVLGPDVEVERVDHLLSGARRCSYRIRSTPVPA